MSKIIYEISIIEMDDQCNNSVSSIEVEYGLTRGRAEKAWRRVIEELKRGEWNHQLRGRKFAYVSAVPYDEDGDCKIGLEWDAISPFFQKKGKTWVVRPYDNETMN